MRRHYLIAKSQMVSGSTECHRSLLGTARRSRIGFETWGDNKVYNNTRGDIKVDIKVDNNVGDDTVKHPQPRTRTTIPYNTRTRSVQHPYKKRRCRLGEVMRGGVLKYAPLTNSLREKVHETIMVACNFVAPKHGMEGIGV